MKKRLPKQGCTASETITHHAAKAVVSLALLILAAGCSPDAELGEARKKLELANQKIVLLEAQLADARAVTSIPNAGSAVEAKLAPVAVPITAAPVAVIGQQWSYDASEEKMSGGKRLTASVESANTVEFDFPYKGPQNGHVVLRTDPKFGKDVMFRIEKGQILCPSYSGCVVQVRFDDEKPANFAASGAADHSSTVVFLSDYNRFLTKLKKAKRVRIAVNIYQQGNPVFEFDVSGFSAAKYQGKG